MSIFLGVDSVLRLRYRGIYIGTIMLKVAAGSY